MLPVAHQKRSLVLACPTESSRLVNRDTMEWVGFVQPTALCSRYKIKIRYSRGFNPQVFVLDPILICRPDRKLIPHMFDQRSLCLFRTRNRHWTSKMLISRTIVPWAALWLYYYELWHSLGEWRGGGEHLTQREIETLKKIRKKKSEIRKIVRTGG